MPQKSSDLPRLVQLKAFVLTAEHESMSAAAIELGVNRSTVSRYISELEGWLGKVLTTGDVPVELTKDGAQFRLVAQQVLDLMEEARAPRPSA